MSLIYIKNMVCQRCIMVVNSELDKAGFSVKRVSLGEVELNDPIDDVKKKRIEKLLVPLGFELIDDRKSRIIEQIKTTIIDQVYHRDAELKINLSELLEQQLHLDYGYLSNLFSELEGTTIEKYFIAQKVERVKELLVYDELSLSEIAYRLNYSSAAHLSNQFKKVTGLTPGHFKSIGTKRRRPIDEV